MLIAIVKKELHLDAVLHRFRNKKDRIDIDLREKALRVVTSLDELTQ